MKYFSQHKTPDITTAESIDREITRACQHVENRCKKRRREYWDIDLHFKDLELEVLRQFKSRRRRKLDSTALITRAMQLGILLDKKMHMSTLNLKISRLKHLVAVERKKGFDRRNTSSLINANLKEDLGLTQTTTAIRNIRIFEHKNEVYQYFRVLKNQHNSKRGIDHLQIPTSWPTASDPITSPLVLEEPKTATDWRETKCPREIEFLVKMRNRMHFGQSEYDKTPFTQEPLKSKFNWSASTSTSELVLEGAYTDPDIDSISKLFLDNCTRVTELDSLPALLSFKDFKGKITNWRESTSEFICKARQQTH